MINQAGAGFKKGIELRKILIFLFIYFIYDSENNDQVEITSMEKKYVFTFLVALIFVGDIGDATGLISPKPI